MLRARSTAILLVLVVLIAGACAMRGQPIRQPAPWIGRERVAPLQKSVVTVINYDWDGSVASIGSGFFISADGVLLTNFHVLDGAYRAAVRMADGSQHPITTILATNPLIDLIKVQVAVSDGQPTPIPLASAEATVLDRVVVIGSPLGLEQTVSEGVISAIRELPAGGAVLQLTAPISQGSSGGPVLNDRGEAVGVITFMAAEGQNLNFAISIDGVSRLGDETPGRPIADWTIRDSLKGPALAATLCRQGARLAFQGEYEEALTYFERAAESNPDDPHAWYGLGSCYAGLDRDADAVLAYQRPIDNDPDNAMAHFILAMYYKTAGQYEREIAALEAVIRIDPANIRARLEMGRAFGALDRTGEQVATYRDILADQPANIPALLDLGMTLERMGQPDEAIALFTRARDLEPANAVIHYNMGVMYGRMGRLGDATDAYVGAIRINPRMAAAHFNLGLIYLKQGVKKRALDQYEILKGLGADTADTLFEQIYPSGVTEKPR